MKYRNEHLLWEWETDIIKYLATELRGEESAELVIVRVITRPVQSQNGIKF